MNKYLVEITKPAESDLCDIVRYIGGELREPKAALAFMDIIKRIVTGLEELPYRHELVSDEFLRKSGIRKVSADNCLIFYSVSETERVVTIIRILYGRRNWNDLL
jgi:toxin ParE1/3/4